MMGPGGLPGLCSLLWCLVPHLITSDVDTPTKGGFPSYSLRSHWDARWLETLNRWTYHTTDSFPGSSRRQHGPLQSEHLPDIWIPSSFCSYVETAILEYRGTHGVADGRSFSDFISACRELLPAQPFDSEGCSCREFRHERLYHQSLSLLRRSGCLSGAEGRSEHGLSAEEAQSLVAMVFKQDNASGLCSVVASSTALLHTLRHAHALNELFMRQSGRGCPSAVRVAQCMSIPLEGEVDQGGDGTELSASLLSKNGIEELDVIFGQGNAWRWPYAFRHALLWHCSHLNSTTTASLCRMGGVMWQAEGNLALIFRRECLSGNGIQKKECENLALKLDCLVNVDNCFGSKSSVSHAAMQKTFESMCLLALRFFREMQSGGTLTHPAYQSSAGLPAPEAVRLPLEDVGWDVALLYADALRDEVSLVREKRSAEV